MARSPSLLFLDVCIARIPPAAWDACPAGDSELTAGEPENPFVSHAFLDALEQSGSVGRKTGWLPQHVVIEDGSGAVLGIFTHIPRFRHGEGATSDVGYSVGGTTKPAWTVAEIDIDQASTPAGAHTARRKGRHSAAKAPNTNGHVTPQTSHDAVMEAADAGIRLVCSITDGIPAQDMIRVKRYLRRYPKEQRTVMVGPNCAGIISPGKSMLGAPQRQWLLDGLAASDATWKLVVSSVPLGIFTGADSWSSANAVGVPRRGQGFVYERDLILRGIRERGLTNVVVVSGDVHHAEVIRHEPSPGFVLHELVAGPLAARAGFPRFLDRSLFSRSLGGLGWVPNFGEIQADGTSLVVRIIDGGGRVRVTQTIAAEDAGVIVEGVPAPAGR